MRYYLLSITGGILIAYISTSIFVKAKTKSYRKRFGV